MHNFRNAPNRKKKVWCGNIRLGVCKRVLAGFLSLPRVQYGKFYLLLRLYAISCTSRPYKLRFQGCDFLIACTTILEDLKLQNLSQAQNESWIPQFVTFCGEIGNEIFEFESQILILHSKKYVLHENAFKNIVSHFMMKKSVTQKRQDLENQEIDEFGVNGDGVDSEGAHGIKNQNWKFKFLMATANIIFITLFQFRMLRVSTFGEKRYTKKTRCDKF